MKKANLTNFLIIMIIYSLFYIVNLLLRQNDIDIYFDLGITDGLKIGLLIIFYLLMMITSVLYSSKKVFDLYIRHIRRTKLINSRYYLVIASLLTCYLFLLFKVEYYYYFGSIILLYLIYFISLYLYDNHFVNKQQKTTVIVNDEVVEKFLNLLGGKDNIISVSYEYSRLKVELKDVKKLNLEEIKELGARGAFVAGNKLQAVIGSNAFELESAITSYISHVK